MLAVRLPQEMQKKLEALARKTGCTKSYYARLAIGEFLDEQEDYYLAMACLERDSAGVPLDEVEKQLGWVD